MVSFLPGINIRCFYFKLKAVKELLTSFIILRQQFLYWELLTIFNNSCTNRHFNIYNPKIWGVVIIFIELYYFIEHTCVKVKDFLITFDKKNKCGGGELNLYASQWKKKIILPTVLLPKLIPTLYEYQ